MPHLFSGTMAHFDHTHEEEAPETAHAARSRRHGMLFLFPIFILPYAGFMAVAAFRTAWLAEPGLLGTRAVDWGMGLTLLAFILAAVYGFLARTPGADQPKSPK